jgi:hypothetical protein
MDWPTAIVTVASIAASSGWLHIQINRNACGGAKCLSSLQELERTRGDAAVKQVVITSSRTNPPETTPIG